MFWLRNKKINFLLHTPKHVSRNAYGIMFPSPHLHQNTCSQSRIKDNIPTLLATLYVIVDNIQTYW